MATSSDSAARDDSSSWQGSSPVAQDPAPAGNDAGGKHFQITKSLHHASSEAGQMVWKSPSPSMSPSLSPRIPSSRVASMAHME